MIKQNRHFDNQQNGSAQRYSEINSRYQQQINLNKHRKKYSLSQNFKDRSKSKRLLKDNRFIDKDSHRDRILSSDQLNKKNKEFNSQCIDRFGNKLFKYQKSTQTNKALKQKLQPSKYVANQPILKKQIQIEEQNFIQSGEFNQRSPHRVSFKMAKSGRDKLKMKLCKLKKQIKQIQQISNSNEQNGRSRKQDTEAEYQSKQRLENKYHHFDRLKDNPKTDQKKINVQIWFNNKQNGKKYSQQKDRQSGLLKCRQIDEQRYSQRIQPKKLNDQYQSQRQPVYKSKTEDVYQLLQIFRQKQRINKKDRSYDDTYNSSNQLFERESKLAIQKKQRVQQISFGINNDQKSSLQSSANQNQNFFNTKSENNGRHGDDQNVQISHYLMVQKSQNKYKSTLDSDNSLNFKNKSNIQLCAQAPRYQPANIKYASSLVERNSMMSEYSSKLLKCKKKHRFNKIEDQQQIFYQEEDLMDQQEPEKCL